MGCYRNHYFLIEKTPFNGEWSENMLHRLYQEKQLRLKRVRDELPRIIDQSLTPLETHSYNPAHCCRQMKPINDIIRGEEW
jgi:hypothetical protein